MSCFFSTGCCLRVAAGIFLSLNALHASAQRGLKLERSFANIDVEVPGLVFIRDYLGFTVEGYQLHFTYLKDRDGGKEVTFQTVDRFGKHFSTKPEKLLRNKKELPQGLLMDADMQLKEGRLLLVTDSLLQIIHAGKTLQRFRKHEATADKYLLTHDGATVYGHFAYPYDEGNFSSGMIRYHINSGRTDTLELPREQLYLTRSKFDNSLCALWGDSTVLMTDIVNYRIFAANPHGPARLLYEAKPETWAQYPDSLESEYAVLELTRGMLAAWDTMATWMQRYSRVEKIMANRRGDVVVRYTLFEEGQQLWAMDFLRREGETLVLDTTIKVTNPGPFAAFDPDIFALNLLRTGSPTFLMEDGSMMALGIAAGKETMIGKTGPELMRFVTQTLPGSKKTMAVYVFRRY